MQGERADEGDRAGFEGGVQLEWGVGGESGRGGRVVGSAGCRFRERGTLGREQAGKCWMGFPISDSPTSVLLGLGGKSGSTLL